MMEKTPFSILLSAHDYVWLHSGHSLETRREVCKILFLASLGTTFGGSVLALAGDSLTAEDIVNSMLGEQ